MERLKIRIIGLGGVGTYLCEMLCRYLNYSNISTVITLVDGDSYESKNYERQIFSKQGNKADVKCTDMRNSYTRLNFEYEPYFVTSDNVDKIVGDDNDVIFLCVDNHHTRKVVSNYVRTLLNVVLISGGNEFTNGNVQLYVRKGGVDRSPSLTDYHPEIANPSDRSPNEMSCEELSKSEPQLLFTNITVAVVMCWVFYAAVIGEKDPVSCAEVYFDIASLSVRSQTRQPNK